VEIELERALADYMMEAPIFVRHLDGRIVYWAEGAHALYGFTASEAVGRSSFDLLATRFPAPLAEIDARLAAEGEWQGRLQRRRRDGRTLWTESLWQLREAGEGEARLVVELSENVTATVLAERRGDVLARELNHRVKNTLSIVQGLARFTFGASDRDDDVARFEGRLATLAGAHDLLLTRNWVDVGLADVVAKTLETFNLENRITLRGPHAQLEPSAAVAYALALHELATNAVKYGALSVPGGRVDVTWTLHEGTCRIRLAWREHGGPVVSRPSKEGFGLRFIRRALSAENGGRVDLSFEPDGLVCEFDGPLQTLPTFPYAQHPG
jgi:two-component system CheB/CheR fusion protein